MTLLDKFTKLKMPKKSGKTSTDGHFENKYYIVFSELDDEPTFELETKLTVGSEVGDIIIDDESISPRHCSFTLNNDVISVLDHNSEAGTFIGKKEIGPGKMFILQDGDNVYVGDVLVEIIIEKVEAPIEDIQEPEEKIQDVEDITQELQHAELEEDEPVVENTGTLELDTQILNSKILESQEELKKEDYSDIDLTVEKKKEIKKVAPKKERTSIINLKESADTPEASSSLIRMLAILADILITLIIYVLLSPFDEFRLFLQDLPNKIWTFIGPYYDAEVAPVVKLFLEENPAIVEMSKDLSSMWNSDYNAFLGGFILFGVIRVIVTFMFGVSLGQLMIGMSAHGNVFVKRIGGAIREVLGIITAPFLIFDLPTLFNFRSFKEIITFTRVYSAGLKKSFLLSFVSLSFLTIFFLLSPLFQGLEFRESFPINKTVIKNIKIDNLDETFYSSHYFGLRIQVPEDIQEFSMFSFKRKDKKLILIPSLKFVNSKNKKEISLVKEKVFNLKKLLKIGFNLNFFAEKSFPDLYKYVHDASAVNSSFKSHKFDDIKIAKELQNLIESSFELDAITFPNHVMAHGPFIKGFVDFRDSLFKVIEDKVSTVKVDKLGDTYFAIFEVQDPKKTKLKLIPLYLNSAYVYELTAQKRGFNFKKVQKLFKNSSWKVENILKNREINYLSFVDEFTKTSSKSNDKQKTSDENYFSELSEKLKKDVMSSKDNEFMSSKWEFTLNNYIRVLEQVKLKNDEQNTTWQKMYQFINELLKTVRNKDNVSSESQIKEEE